MRSASVDVEFDQEEGLAVLRVDAPAHLAAFHRHLLSVHERLFDLGAGRLLVDASAVASDLDVADFQRLMGEHPKVAPPFAPIRIAVALDPTYICLNILFSLIFNAGHCVAVFGRSGEALAWLQKNNDLRRDCLARALFAQNDRGC